MQNTQSKQCMLQLRLIFFLIYFTYLVGGIRGCMRARVFCFSRSNICRTLRHTIISSRSLRSYDGIRWCLFDKMMLCKMQFLIYFRLFFWRRWNIRKTCVIASLSSYFAFKFKGQINQIERHNRISTKINESKCSVFGRIMYCFW